MPGKDPSEAPAAPPGTAAPPTAAEALKGLAGRLAVALNQKADAFLADLANGADIDKTARSITLIARAGVAVHALQAMQDKAADGADERAAAARRNPPPAEDEGDDTDMHDHDPRLDTPEGVDEIYRSARRSVCDLRRQLEIKRADEDAGFQGGGLGGGSELAGEGPAFAAPA